MANHTGWDHVWTKTHPEYYEKDPATKDFKIASGMDDIIELDAKKNMINLKVHAAVIAERRKNWQQPALKVTKGVLYKYAQCVKDASEGCVTDTP